MARYFEINFCLKKFRNLLFWLFKTECATETVSGNGGAEDLHWCSCSEMVALLLLSLTKHICSDGKSFPRSFVLQLPSLSFPQRQPLSAKPGKDQSVIIPIKTIKMQKYEVDRVAVFSYANISTFELVKLCRLIPLTSQCRFEYPHFIACGVGEWLEEKTKESSVIPCNVH